MSMVVRLLQWALVLAAVIALSSYFVGMGRNAHHRRRTGRERR